MKKIQPKWVVDKYIFEGSRIPVEVFEELGIEFFEYDYIPFLIEDRRIPFDPSEPVITYTTLGVVKKMRQFFGCYYDDLKYNCNVYMSLLDVDDRMFLNHDHLYCTLSDLITKPNYYFELMGIDQLFFRPNRGCKEFTGDVWSMEQLPRELDAIVKMYGVDLDSMILISTPKKIFEEERFIVGNREILASSRYAVEGIHVEDTKVNLESKESVQRILDTSDWLPDTLFCIDIATTNEGPKIVELNSFSCSGWYAMDPREVVRKASDVVMEEYRKQL